MARGTLLVTIAALLALTIPSLAPATDTPLTGLTQARADGMGTAFVGIPDLADDGIETTPVFTSTVSNGAEPAILVDRLGRGILVGDHLGVKRSTNGGASWSTVSIPWIPGHDPVFGVGIYDGWVFAQDDAGTIYASTTDGPVINVASSQDGGATWDVGISTFVVDVSARIADRPWLAARNDGQVAMIWNDGGASQACSYSTDGALTFTKKSLLSNVPPIGGLPAFDKNGGLIFASNGGIGGGARNLYRYSGSPCSGGVTTVDMGAAGEQLSTQVVADAAGNYVARPSADGTKMQILGVPGMTMGGAKTLVVSPATLKGNTFGTIAYREGAGEMAVAWYGTATAGDFSEPGFNGQWNVYVARVRDFWTATPQVVVQQVTSTPNHVGDFCFSGTGCDLSGAGDRDLLDYFQITYDAAGQLHLAYGHDGTTANPQVIYARLPALT